MTVTLSDVLIVGAGPAGLFAAFELGLFDIKCHLVDSLDRPGGQCAALYADKPIYDVPGHPVILAQKLVDRLVEQTAPFKPYFTFNRTVTGLERLQDGSFRALTDAGEAFDARVVALAAGYGSLADKRAPIAGILPVDGPIPSDTARFETSVPGVFAIGDAALYPGKLPLLLSAFHEAALMTQAIRRSLNPQGRAKLQYTSSSSSLQKKLGVAD